MKKIPQIILYILLAASQVANAIEYATPEELVGWFKENAEKRESFKIRLEMAEEGDRTFQYMVAKAYENGEGVNVDYEQAVKWYEKSAQQGYLLPLRDLSMLYAMGKGVPKDNVMAHMYANLETARGVSQGEKTMEVLEQYMTRADISEATRLAREWTAKYR